MGIRRAVVVLGLSLLGASLLFGTPVITVPGLVGYWRLDETASPAADDSGSGNNGTWAGTGLNSSAVPPAGPPGIGFTNPNCVLLNGVDQYVNIGTPAALNLTAEISVACWINLANVTGEKKALAKWADTPSGAFSWLLSVTGDTAFFAVQTSGTILAAAPAGAFIAGQWYHLAGTYDGTTVRLYIDGAQVATAATTGAIASSSAPVRIGAGSGTDLTQEEPFAGSIDDVRIYNYDLSATEVATLRAGQLPGVPVLTAQDQVGSVSLSWTAAAGAVTYDVQRGPALAGPFATIQSQSTLTYSDTGGTVGTPYFYQIVAVNVVGTSTSTPPQQGTSLFPPPRTNDHDEGLLGDRCDCGSTAGVPAPGWLAALVLLALPRRRRS